jgi:hypothetical protein
MPEHDGLMRIFWPLDISRTDSPGVIIGWRNSGLDVFAVAILEDVDVSFETTWLCRFADVGEGTERRERLEGWNSISKRKPPH